MTIGNVIGRVWLAALVVAALAPARAGAQIPWTFGRVAAPGTPAPPGFGGGLYSSVGTPSIAPDGRVIFRGEVAGAVTPACTGTCRAIVRATPDADCSFFLQPSRTFPIVDPMVLEGQTVGAGTFLTLDDAPTAGALPIFHTSCFEKSGQFEGVFEGQTTVERTALGGLPCGRLYSSPAAGLEGAAYWRALFEAIVFWRSGPHTSTDLVVPAAPTNTRVGGQFANLAKAGSVGWETLERRLTSSEANRVAFLADVTGVDTSPTCLGTELACDGAFVVDAASGAVSVAAARNDALAGGGTIARFCGPPAVSDSGLVVFRALTSPTGDCNPVSGGGQGIYAIAAPFLPGTAVTLADAATPLPDREGGLFTTQIFSDPVVSTTGAVFFRAGSPTAGAGTAVLVRALPPFGLPDRTAVARKGPVAVPDSGVFSSFDPAAPSTNGRGEVAFLSGEGIWVAVPRPVVLEDCADAVSLCRGTITAVAARLVTGEGRAVQTCYRKILKGKSAPIDCWTQHIQTVMKVERLREAVGRLITFSCSDDVIPLAGACNPAQPTVAGEIDCIIDTHESAVRAIMDALTR
jgi:hypothetical protein